LQRRERALDNALIRPCFLERLSRAALPHCGDQGLNLLAAAHTTGARNIPALVPCHHHRGVDWQVKIDDARFKLKSIYPKIKL
jgi:hypothetical protein